MRRREILFSAASVALFLVTAGSLLMALAAGAFLFMEALSADTPAMSTAIGFVLAVAMTFASYRMGVFLERERRRRREGQRGFDILPAIPPDEPGPPP